MKHYLFTFLIISFTLFSCSSDSEDTLEPVSIKIHFSNVWDDYPITKEDFGIIKYKDKNNDDLSIKKLRYLISDINLTHQSGFVVSLKDYQLIDLDDENSLIFTTSKSIPPGNYEKITFRFGFSNDDNIDGDYPDLNIANFNVPELLGGGYHYMQLDGDYLDVNQESAPYNYHVIPAYDTATETKQDTSFSLDIGNAEINDNTNIYIKTDISQWFENPNTWNLNDLNTNLMSNYDAQIIMNQNGRSGVFNLDNISQ